MKHHLSIRISFFFTLFLIVLSACRDTPKGITAQEVVDRAIADAGGELYEQSEFQFRFRDMVYSLKREGGKRVMSRVRPTDSGEVTDVWDGSQFRRYFMEKVVPVTDSMANVYSNSINSVHYFAYLPYGLNDAAVNKEIAGEKKIGERVYHKIKVTFKQEGGGEDFEDVYIYWIDSETFKPRYLAYEFHVNGGGLRFREAYNERYINGIRFVDYRNYRPKGEADITQLDSLFESGELELLSDIRLEDIEVSRDNYN